MKKTIWILLDNRIGSRHQAEGVAHYLDTNTFNVICKEIDYTKWSALPNFIRGKTLLGLTQKTKENLTSPYPDFVLSSSRRTAPIARYIKKKSPQTKLIQLLHIGRTGIKDFAKIFVPEHDKHKFKSPNISYTIGSPHFITKEKLSTAYEEWKDFFAKYPRPLTAVIIGGAIKKRQFTLENAELLAKQISTYKEKIGGSLLITTSRRTGSLAEQKIMSYLKNFPHYAYLWQSKDKNPYLGFLACADDIIVTGDSVSMCCEALATERPIQIFTGNNWLTQKHLRFISSLYSNGYAKELLTPDNKKNTQHTLNTAKQIADEISRL